MPTITPFLWFDRELEAATEFYTGVFGAESAALTRDASGAVFSAEFELAGQRLFGLNGGPGHPFTDAVSLFVHCADQAEVDRLWDALVDGGEAIACGWLADRYGLRWQIIPVRLMELLADPDAARAERARQAMLGMVKIDVAALEAAAG